METSIIKKGKVVVLILYVYFCLIGDDYFFSRAVADLDEVDPRS